MKKTIKILIAVLILIAVVAVFLIWGFSDTDWNEASGTYGDLNIIELDDSENDELKNETSASYDLSQSQIRDCYFSGQLNVTNGTTDIKITIDDEVVYEKSFGEGTYEIKTDIFEDCSGEACIYISASDDVDGNYSVSIFTRKKNIDKIIGN